MSGNREGDDAVGDFGWSEAFDEVRRVRCGVHVVGVDPHLRSETLGVAVRVGDVVQVTASLDARQVGRQWKVLAVPTQAWALLRRCPVDPM